jgi:hypothetical protein
MSAKIRKIRENIEISSCEQIESVGSCATLARASCDPRKFINFPDTRVYVLLPPTAARCVSNCRLRNNARGRSLMLDLACVSVIFRSPNQKMVAVCSNQMDILGCAARLDAALHLQGMLRGGALVRVRPAPMPAQERVPAWVSTKKPLPDVKMVQIPSFSAACRSVGSILLVQLSCPHSTTVPAGAREVDTSVVGMHCIMPTHDNLSTRAASSTVVVAVAVLPAAAAASP